MIYSLFVGRWQCSPPHKGHIALIETELKQGNNALIAIRDTKISKDNPYTVKERKKMLKKAFKKWGDQVKIIKIDDINKICWGRDVGYELKKIVLPDEIEKISGTKIRNK